jgi:hypothetical protein
MVRRTMNAVPAVAQARRYIQTCGLVGKAVFSAAERVLVLLALTSTCQEFPTEFRCYSLNS